VTPGRADPGPTASSRARRRLTPQIRRRLADLAALPVNYDPAALDLEHPAADWNVDRRCQPLPAERPGEPAHEGSFEIAARLIRDYEFADPSIVRAFYDPGHPLEGRDMLLELRALGLVRVYVGVRVCEVYDETRELNGRRARVFGWSYRTLEGHVEQGQMYWEVWKWLDTGEVQFRVHAISRPAPIANPIVRIGFWLLRGHERTAFLNNTDRRMRELTEFGLDREHGGERIRRTGAELTAEAYGTEDERSLHTAHVRTAHPQAGPVD
jgi:uncharacterized protein (UPF0548 family)